MAIIQNDTELDVHITIGGTEYHVKPLSKTAPISDEVAKQWVGVHQFLTVVEDESEVESEKILADIITTDEDVEITQDN